MGTFASTGSLSLIEMTDSGFGAAGALGGAMGVKGTTRNFRGTLRVEDATSTSEGVTCAERTTGALRGTGGAFWAKLDGS
jgi:hypothetical protein